MKLYQISRCWRPNSLDNHNELQSSNPTLRTRCLDFYSNKEGSKGPMSTDALQRATTNPITLIFSNSSHRSKMVLVLGLSNSEGWLMKSVSRHLYDRIPTLTTTNYKCKPFAWTLVQGGWKFNQETESIFCFVLLNLIFRCAVTL